jgi:hypothetical protein
MKLPVKVALTLVLIVGVSLLAMTLIAQTVTRGEQETKQDRAKRQEIEIQTKQKPTSDIAGSLPTPVAKKFPNAANQTLQSKNTSNSREATVEAETARVLLDCSPFEYFYFTGTGPANTSRQVIMRQTNPGVIGYSNSSEGPFTPELTITLQYDAQGNVVYQQHYVQGTQVGLSTVRICYQGVVPEQPEQCSDWFSLNVKECACPDIPILP